jgi:hypothetical protein
MELKFGFSTGSLHKEFSTKEALAFLKKSGIKVVELGFVKMDRIQKGWADELTEEDLEGFNYMSLHSPVIKYGKNIETEIVFEKINKINKLRKLDLVVFHPDTVEDFSVFENQNFPIGFENMDNRKNAYKNPDDLQKLLDNSDFGMILDVNHICTNDPTMTLAKEFYDRLGNKIKEIHLSGYTAYHEPLFQTLQRKIIESIVDFGVPIINEAVINSTDILKERDYVITEIEKIILERK